MGKLYLIRHGRTEANEKWLYCGSTDLPLSESGMKLLENIHYDVPENCVFMTSGMLRSSALYPNAESMARSVGFLAATVTSAPRAFSLAARHLPILPQPITSTGQP